MTTPTSRLVFGMSVALTAACGGAKTTATPSTEAGAGAADPAVSATPAPSSAGGPASAAPAASSAPPASASAKPADAPAEVTEEELVFSTGGTGTLPATTIRKVLRDKLPAITACYQTAHDEDRAFKGRFAAHFRIDKTGAVKNVEIRGKKTNAKFSSCLADQITALKFPKPKGGEVQVVYPLDFSEQ